MELKIRTKEQQMIDAFKKYIKTKGNVTLDYSLEAYMQVALDHISSLEKENQELKKQLSNSHQIKKQQKEFIEWLESGIKECKDAEEKYADGDDNSYYNNNELRIEILSKYKEIIGGKDE